MPHRFPPPWRIERIEGGYKVLDAEGQSLAYVYGTAATEEIARPRAVELGKQEALKGSAPGLLSKLVRIRFCRVGSDALQSNPQYANEFPCAGADER
jgi:hypothetical protein